MKVGEQDSQLIDSLKQAPIIEEAPGTGTSVEQQRRSTVADEHGGGLTALARHPAPAPKYPRLHSSEASRISPPRRNGGNPAHPPWPLRRDEIEAFATDELDIARI